MAAGSDVLPAAILEWNTGTASVAQCPNAPATTISCRTRATRSVRRARQELRRVRRSLFARRADGALDVRFMPMPEECHCVASGRVGLATVDPQPRLVVVVAKPRQPSLLGRSAAAPCSHSLHLRRQHADFPLELVLALDEFGPGRFPSSPHDAERRRSFGWSQHLVLLRCANATGGSEWLSPRQQQARPAMADLTSSATGCTT